MTSGPTPAAAPPTTSTAASTSSPASRALLVALGAALLLGGLDAYVVASLLPAMIADLGVPLDHLERATPVLSGFLAAYAVAIPLFGPLSDARGRRLAFAVALVLFAAGSALTAQAPDVTWLTAGRAVQGFAGGALVPVSLAIVADLFAAGGARALALGAVAGAQELGSLAGPLYGAAVSQWLGGWRAVFWVNVALAAACLAAFLVTSRRLPAEPVRRRLGWAPGATLAAAVGLFVLALYPDDPARSPVGSRFWPLLAAAAVALAAFTVLQRREATALLSRATRRAGAVRAGVAVNLLVGAALVAALAELPVLAASLFGLDELGSALLLGRFLAGVPLGALAGGVLAGRSPRLPAAAGMALAAFAFTRMAAWDAAEPFRRLGPFAEVDLVLLLAGLGFGLVIAPVAVTILDAASAEEHGAASAVAVLARTAGMLVGFAVLAADGFHRFYGDLAACPRGGGLGALLGGGFAACATSALRDQYHDVFLIAAGVSAAAALLALAAIRPARRTT